MRERVEVILEETVADEMILTAHIYDHGAMMRSFELAAQAMKEINVAGVKGSPVKSGR